MPSPEDPALPATISIIRHAEKQLGDAPPQGISIDGTADPELLTPRGWQRAGALISLFVARPGVERTAANAVATVRVGARAA